MLRFGVSNMRRLKVVEPIDIRPITILVGRNSSGKSTFLRTFPLIRQSLMTRTSSPILWYGDLVDFGDYSSAVSDGKQSEGISLSFGVDEILPVRTLRRYARQAYQVDFESLGPIDLNIKIIPDGNRVRLDHIHVKYGQNSKTFKLKLDENCNVTDIKFNGEPVDDFFVGMYFSFSQGSLFPDLILRPKKQDHIRYFFDDYRWLISSFINIIKPHITRRIGDEQYEKFCLNFFSMGGFDSSSLSLLEKSLDPKSFKVLVSSIRLKSNSKLRKKLKNLFEISRLIAFLPSVFFSLKETLGSTLYIGPVRAKSERYYRYQDLAVSEIDPDGKNFPMFLNSLSTNRRRDFSNWVQKRFGYGVEVETRSGHISINLAVGNYKTNIVDNGYGISQVLPVLGQLWWASRGSRSRANLSVENSSLNTLLVIEQPELHLHPAHQALIADAVASEQNGSDNDGYKKKLTCIIETHSEALINRLGELIAAGKLKASDVQILIFEPTDHLPERETNIRLAQFDLDGTLINWPYGFFQPGSEL